MAQDALEILLVDRVKDAGAAALLDYHSTVSAAFSTVGSTPRVW